MSKQETRIKRGHITLMKHPSTALYSGVMLMGTSSVEENVQTAYTDGINKKYGRKFLESITSEASVRGLILHENLHVALKHVVFGSAMFRENHKLANIAADFVVNDIIVSIDGTVAGTSERLVALPTEGSVYDPMFHDWSMREVYNYLKKHCKGGGGQGQGNPPPSGGKQSNDGDGGDNEVYGDEDTITVNGKTYDISQSDEHDFIGRELSPEEAKEVMGDIDKALREGGMLAGRMGAKIPRVISDLLEPKIDWREALREFVSASTRYFSINSSLASAAISMTYSLHSLQRSSISSGISFSTKVIPKLFSSQIIAFIFTRSTTPEKLSSNPIGNCIGTGLAPKRDFICSITRRKSAPNLSILLTKTNLGTLYLSA